MRLPQRNWTECRKNGEGILNNAHLTQGRGSDKHFLANFREVLEQEKEKKVQLQRERGEAARLEREEMISQQFAKKVEQVEVRGV